MPRVDNLRKLAELNLCERCFKMYKAIIEPTIKKWLFTPLDEWRRAESYILQTTMRVAGAYKTSVNVIYIKEEELASQAELIDVETFRKIMHWSFKRRIDYLHKIGRLSSHFFG
jgi:hypothetical protein